jgi:hypothetical protein
VKGLDADQRHIRSSGFVERSYTSGITAFAGGGQASATQLTTDFNRVPTVATAADSVKLPDAVVGRAIFVKNAHATNSLNVFPKTGEAINALAANAAFALAATKAAWFVCTLSGTWDTILTA